MIKSVTTLLTKGSLAQGRPFRLPGLRWLLAGFLLLWGCSFTMFGRNYQFAAKPEPTPTPTILPPVFIPAPVATPTPSPTPCVQYLPPVKRVHRHHRHVAKKPTQPGWFFTLTKGSTVLHIGPYPFQNDKGHGIAICRDWLGSMGCAHPKTCAVGGSCACIARDIAPGIAGAIGAVPSNDCTQGTFPPLKRGHYKVTADMAIHGPYTRQQCVKLYPGPKPRISTCFGVGKISNFEGFNE
jgi:hypothetical protein